MTMMQYEMPEARNHLGGGYNLFQNDDTKSMTSSLSSFNMDNDSCDSSSLFSYEDKEEEYTYNCNTRSPVATTSEATTATVQKRTQILKSETVSTESPTTVTINHDCTISSTKEEGRICKKSCGLEGDDWKSQDNRTYKTDKTGTTGCTSFCTGKTDTTGATKLHRNGISAMLHRRLRRKKSDYNRDNNNHHQSTIGGYSSVPTSINTRIRRPVSFDSRIVHVSSNNASNLVAPSKIERPTSSYQRIYSKSSLKNNKNPSRRQIDKGVTGNSWCIDESSIVHCTNDSTTIAEDGNYHAGSQSIGEFVRTIFMCCHSECLNE
jgi:hypothetical protein